MLRAPDAVSVQGPGVPGHRPRMPVVLIAA
jgi:hypothetical protein